MIKRPGVMRHGTARDLADVGAGYCASGASEHSRHAAHGSKIDEAAEPEKIMGSERIEEGRAHGRGKRTRWQLIQENHKRIAGIARWMKTETDPLILAKLRKSYLIKSGFLSRLHAESKREANVNQSSSPPTRQTREGPSADHISEVEEPGSWHIETIPGEHDVDPW